MLEKGGEMLQSKVMRKVSVILPEDLHKNIKLKTIKEGTTIQRVFEDIAESIILEFSNNPSKLFLSAEQREKLHRELDAVLKNGERVFVQAVSASISASFVHLRL